MVTEKKESANKPQELGSRGFTPAGMDSLPSDQPQAELMLPVPSASGGAVDPQVFEAWKQHMIQGFERNNKMFASILDAFIRPYWLTVRMYQAMFVVGLSGLVLAAVLGVTQGISFGVLFGGMSIVSFLTFFLSRPLASLEQNIQFITWLGLVYNTYWTRLMYANNEATIQTDLEDILNRSVEDIVALLDKQAELTGKRPGLPEDKNSGGEV
jgi:hypothetical protein